MFNKVVKNKEKTDRLLKAQKKFEKISKLIVPSQETRDKIFALRDQYAIETNTLKDEFNRKIYDLTVIGIEAEIKLLEEELKN